MDSANAEIPLSYGLALFQAARYEEAAALFREASSLEDDFALPLTNLAAALHMQGEFGQAAEALQAALRIRPDPATYSNLGTLYFFQGLYPQAVSAFEQAIEHGANDYLVWANLGDAYRWTSGREEDAQRAFTRALQLIDIDGQSGSEEFTIKSRRAVLLAKTAKTAAAAAASAEALSAAPDDPSMLYRAALVSEICGNRTAALALLSRAIDAGYSESEIRHDPEFGALREDRRYHDMLADRAIDSE